VGKSRGLPQNPKSLHTSCKLFFYTIHAEAGFRVELDARRETLGYRIRYHQTHKTPYMLILGDKEVEGGLVSVRSRDAGDLGQMTIEALLERLSNEAG